MGRTGGRLVQEQERSRILEELRVTTERLGSHVS